MSPVAPTSSTCLLFLLGRIAHAMKTIIVIVFYLLLNTLASSAKDFHLVARYVYDDSTTWTNHEMVFVLLSSNDQLAVTGFTFLVQFMS